MLWGYIITFSKKKNSVTVTEHFCLPMLYEIRREVYSNTNFSYFLRTVFA